MNFGKFCPRFVCSSCIEPELSTTKTMSILSQPCDCWPPPLPPPPLLPLPPVPVPPAPPPVPALPPPPCVGELGLLQAAARSAAKNMSLMRHLATGRSLMVVRNPAERKGTP